MKRFLLSALLLSTASSTDIMKREQEVEATSSTRGKGLPWDQPRHDINVFPLRRTLWDGPFPTDLPHDSLPRDSNINGPDIPVLPKCSSDGSCKFPVMRNPLLQVSFDLRELLDNPGMMSKEECDSDKCQRRNGKMRIREPFYVEEPRWIQISQDYPDGFTRRFGKTDPFFGTRGKRRNSKL